MAKTDPKQTQKGSGVEELIDQLKRDGVESGQAEAERIIAAARDEADRLLEDARGEAERILSQGCEDLRRERQAVEDALRQASRDLLIGLRTDLGNRMRSRIEELCADALREPELLKALIIAAVHHEVPSGEAMEVAVSVLEGEDGAAPDDAASVWLQGELRELLREGVELAARPGQQPGLRIRLHEREALVEVSPEALAELLWERMIPRFRHLLAFRE